MRVALTFDAEHPSRPRTGPGVQDAVVKHLDETGVTATFFMQGRWANAYPNIARRIAAAGHRIGNHSHYHARLSFLTNEGIDADVRDAQAAIRSVTGSDPRPWFRCPFGDGADDNRVLGALARLGYRHVGWHVESEDWDESRTTDQVKQAVLDGVRARGDGAVVLFHTWPSTTADVLPAIISTLRNDGTEFVPVDDLLGG